MTPFAAFEAVCARLKPTAAVVLGSGLGGTAAGCAAAATLDYVDIPGLVPPTVAGHRGQLAVGRWARTPVLVCLGRVHYYEGHPWDRVTRLVHLCADLGVGRVVLTNAAGGIRPDLDPGDLMAITAHLPLLGRADWRNPLPVAGPYTPELVAVARNAGLAAGVYAALTGPCYETPAEIRALLALGADAVGMSTAREAEAALARGLQVAGVSCVTNKAAGLAPGALAHAEVEATARTAVDRLAAAVAALVAAP